MLLYHKDNQVIDKTSLRNPYNNLHRLKIGHNGMHLLAKMPRIMYMTLITKAYVKKNNKIKNIHKIMSLEERNVNLWVKNVILSIQDF